MAWLRQPASSKANAAASVTSHRARAGCCPTTSHDAQGTSPPTASIPGVSCRGAASNAPLVAMASLLNCLGNRIGAQLAVNTSAVAVPACPRLALECRAIAHLLQSPCSHRAIEHRAATAEALGRRPTETSLGEVAWPTSPLSDKEQKRLQGRQWAKSNAAHSSLAT